MTAKLSNGEISAGTELQLFYARWRAIASLVFTFVWALATIYGCYGVSFAIGNELALLLLAPCILFLLWRAYRAVNILRWQGPVVIIDDDGITDLRRSDKAIPWCALRGFSRGTYRNQLGIVLKFHNMQTAQQYLGASAWIEGISLKMKFENGECFVGLSPLAYRYNTVAASMQTFLRRAETNTIPI